MNKSFFSSPIFQNIILIGILTLIVKIVAFYKEMMIGNTLGLSLTLDTFLIAILIPGFINNVFASSFQNVFIPNYINYLNLKNDPGEFQTACFILSITLSVILSIITFFLSNLLLENIYPNKSIEYYSLIRKQFYILLPCIIIWALSSIFIGILKVNELYKYSSIYPIITSVFTLFFLSYYNILGSNTLAFGMLFGSIFEFFFLFYILNKYKILKITKPNYKHSSIILLVKQFPIKTASSLISGTSGFVSQYFAAQLAIGSISTINYGSKIPSIISMIITTSISSIFLTYFSKLVLIDKNKAFRKLKKTLFILIISTTLFSILIYNSSEFIIKFLFENGNFTKHDTLRVSSIQKILIFNVPFYCSSILIISFLTSINKNNFMLYASIINLLSNILLSRYLVEFMNIEGLALANLIMYALNFLVLFSFLHLYCNKYFEECSS